jgi:hypothetical protein
VGTIVITSLVITGLLAALATPLWIVYWRKRRLAGARNFLIGAGVVGVVCGLLAGASERQVNQCLEAGNSDCVDSGTIGLQLVFVIVYVVTVWVMAYLAWRD